MSSDRLLLIEEFILKSRTSISGARGIGGETGRGGGGAAGVWGGSDDDDFVSDVIMVNWWWWGGAKVNDSDAEIWRKSRNVCGLRGQYTWLKLVVRVVRGDQGGFCLE